LWPLPSGITVCQCVPAVMLRAIFSLLWSVCTLCRDGWDTLLLNSLLLLRDVCQRLKLQKEFLLHSLEVASLADSLQRTTTPDTQAAASGLFDHEQAQGLASAALLGLLAGPQDSKSSLKKAAQQQAPAQQQEQLSPPQQQQQQQDDHGQSQAVVDSSQHNGSSGSSWEYEVQQLDLGAGLQQLPTSQGDASRTSGIAEVLLL